jgi:hypothetical protein
MVQGDDIIDITFGGHDGTAFRVKSSIIAIVTGPVSANVVPTDLLFSTSATTSGPIEAVRINSQQQTLFNGPISLRNYADATARNTGIPTPTAGMMVYISGTGKFQGYNGVTSTWDDLN